MSELATTALWGLSYICLSACLIHFNKWMFQRDRFPYPMHLVVYHTFLTGSVVTVLFWLRPSLFPSLGAPGQPPVLSSAGPVGSWSWLVRNAVPISLILTGQLVVSNTSYMHSSVAFVQMMKESNIVLVYFLSVLVASEVFRWPVFQVLVLLIAATTFTLQGEVNFSWTSFKIQAVSQIFESSKITLQGYLLCGKKLDPFSYLLLVLPFCAFFVTLALVLCALGLNVVPSPSLADIRANGAALAANGFCAVALNIVAANFVKASSAVSFVLAGIIKDTCIVVTSTLVMREVVTLEQGCGFTLQILLIGLYSTIKLQPQKYEVGLLDGMSRVMIEGFGTECGSTAGLPEKGVPQDVTALLPKKAGNTEPSCKDQIAKLPKPGMDKDSIAV